MLAARRPARRALCVCARARACARENHRQRPQTFDPPSLACRRSNCPAATAEDRRACGSAASATAATQNAGVSRRAVVALVVAFVALVAPSRRRVFYAKRSKNSLAHGRGATASCVCDRSPHDCIQTIRPGARIAFAATATVATEIYTMSADGSDCALTFNTTKTIAHVVARRQKIASRASRRAD